MRRILTILFTVSLATTTVDAIEIGAFESALETLELTDAQTTMIGASTRNYRRTAKSLASRKAQMEVLLVAHSGVTAVDQVAEMIRMEADILTTFVLMRKRVRSVLHAGQREELDAFLEEHMTSRDDALAEKRGDTGTVAF